MSEVKNNTVVKFSPIESAKAIPAKLQMQLGDVISEDAEQQKAFLRSYARKQILKKFGIVEVLHFNDQSGQLYFGKCSTRVKLALPEVLPTEKKDAANGLNAYMVRVKPILEQWLKDSIFAAEMIDANNAFTPVV